MGDQSDSQKKIPWDDANPLERVQGRALGGAYYETPRQNQALRDYAMLGGDRSLRRLHAVYTKRCLAEDPPQDVDFVAMWEGRSDGAPPTATLSTLSKWSSTNDWQARIDKMTDLAAAVELEALNALIEEGKRLVVTKGVEQGRFFLDAVDRVKDALTERLVSVDHAVQLEPGKPAKVIVTIDTANLDELLDLADLHLKGATMVRRAVGLPDKYTQTNLAGVDDGAPIKVKGYSVVSPDDWDEPAEVPTDCGDEDADEPAESNEGGSDGDV